MKGAKDSAITRVLLVGHQFQVPSEGQAKAEALAALHGLEVHVLTPSRYREGGGAWRTPCIPRGAPYGFHVAKVRLGWAGPAKWYLQSYLGLGAILTRLNPDIIDVWEEPWNLLSAQICRARAALLPEAKLISETEQNVSKRLPFPFEKFRDYTFRHADFLVGRNAEALKVAMDKGFRGPACVVGNGVDTAHFAPHQRPEGNVPASSGLQQDSARAGGGLSATGWCSCPTGRDLAEQRVVGYAGRLVPEKGLDTLLAAVASFGGACRLRVCGDGPLRERLLGTPQVEWVGNLPRESLLDFYRSLDVLVLPSRTTSRWKEQFGRVLIEAQACGIPVVGSSSGAIPEVLGDAGLVFPENDAAGLAAALACLFEDGELWNRMSGAGRRRVLERYSWQAIAFQMAEVYRRLHTSSHPAGTPVRAQGRPGDWSRAVG